MPDLAWSWSATFAVVAAACAGWPLVRPFASENGPFAWALAFVAGSACWAVGADAGLKLFGSGWLGFAGAPALLAALLAAASRRSLREGATPPPSDSAACAGTETELPEITRGQLLLALLFAAVAVAQIMPWRTAAGVAWGTPEMDWRSRVPVVGAIARDGLPAANPFFDPDGQHRLFFYYGWFLPPAAATRLGGAEPAAALLVFMAAGAAALAVVAMGLANGLAGDRRAGTVAGCLLYVTGLDLLPVLALEAKGIHPQSLEWWNPAQVTALHAFPVWVPHHAMATLEILAALLFLHRARFASMPPGRAWLAPAVLLAGAGMSSTYVALVGFLATALAGLGAWPHDRRAARTAFAAVAIGGAACVPFYWQLSQLDRAQVPSLALILRPFASEGDLRDLLAARTGLAPAPALFLTRLFGLLPQYLIEFGVYFLALLWWWKTRLGMRPGGWGRPLALLAAVAFALGSTVVSVRTWNCDLNWRVMHVAQLALLAVAGNFLLRMPRGDRLVAGLLLAIGLAGTGYDLWRVRTDIGREHPVQLRQAELAADAGRRLNAELPWTARLLIDPDGNPHWMHHLRHRIVLADATFNAFPYGPRKDDVERTIAEVRRLYDAKTSAAERAALLAGLDVDAVLVEAGSPLFAAAPGAFGPAAEVAWQSDVCKLVRTPRR